MFKMMSSLSSQSVLGSETGARILTVFKEQFPLKFLLKIVRGKLHPLTAIV